MNDTKPEKNWPEDFSHENGMYYCRCRVCNEQFVGYKRRVVCRECDVALNAALNAGADTMAGDGGYSIGTKEGYDEFVKNKNLK